MGHAWSTLVDYCPDSVSRVMGQASSRKRKKEELSEDEVEMMNVLSSPKRRKLICTTKYIYHALFIEGKDSDITVHILEKDWKLHKIYLGQSQYFSSMFSGAWNESNKSYISIEVGDPNITNEALTTVFGSFYLDEIVVEPRLVVGVLAGAVMFQLVGLIEQCNEIMLETISPLSAVQYYQAACRYGVLNVKDRVIDWFLVNLTSHYLKHASRLQEIETELMSTILKRPGLCVMPSEIVLYYLLRKWIFLRNRQTSEPPLESSQEYENFFRQKDDPGPFLLTEKGKEFIDLFKELKLNHLLLHVQDSSVIICDNIIPESWMLPHFKNNWISLLRVSSGADKGPTNIDENLFHKHAVRCGRVINVGDSRSWRWNFFNYGIDLMWALADNSIFVLRHKQNIDLRSMSNPQSHNVIIQIEVMNLDEQLQKKRSVKSNILSLALSRNLETKLLEFGEEFEFPLHIAVKVLLVTPVQADSETTS